MYKNIHIVKNPKLLVITALRENDKISKKTKTGIKRNDVPFDWVSYSSNDNIPTNVELAIEEYKDITKVPDYIIKIDNDVDPQRGMLDVMYETLSNSKNNVAYCYPPFRYILSDGRYIEFEYQQFNREKLLQQNYITSNSMIKYDKLVEIGGFVKDDKYVRLLDWCLWLKFLEYGYIGIPSKKGFVTSLNKDNISARSEEDYKLKYNRVQEDFINKLKNRR